MIVEAILLMVLFLGVSVAIANYFKDNEVVAQIVSKPWKSMAGVLQNGVWQEPDRGAAQHPSQHLRHVSIEGDPP